MPLFETEEEELQPAQDEAPEAPESDGEGTEPEGE